MKNQRTIKLKFQKVNKVNVADISHSNLHKSYTLEPYITTHLRGFNISFNFVVFIYLEELKKIVNYKMRKEILFQYVIFSIVMLQCIYYSSV